MDQPTSSRRYAGPVPVRILDGTFLPVAPNGAYYARREGPRCWVMAFTTLDKLWAWQRAVDQEVAEVRSVLPGCAEAIMESVSRNGYTGVALDLRLNEEGDVQWQGIVQPDPLNPNN